ncbi:MAG: AzlD domain-containing protein [Oceanospirillum sp.]|nr:AzlD domain-containing protein [Oceanospirillum sp.]
MILLTIFILAALVFLSRYLFLEPRLPLRLSARGERFLHFSAPAVLTAIAAPVVLLPEQGGSESPELWLSWDNPYLLAALLCVVLARFTGNVLLTTVLGMGSFVLLKQLVLI